VIIIYSALIVLHLLKSIGKRSEKYRAMKGAGKLAVMVQEVLMILRYFEGLNHIIPDGHIGECLYIVIIIFDVLMGFL